MTDGTEVPADLRVIPLRNVSAAMNVSERTLRTYLANLDIGIVAPSGKKLGNHRRRLCPAHRRFEAAGS